MTRPPRQKTRRAHTNDRQLAAVNQIRHYQTNSHRQGNRSSYWNLRPRVRAIGQGGGAVLFEHFTAVEVAFVIEKVVDRGVDGGEFLQGASVPERRHRFLPSSEWLLRVLGPIVKPTAAFLVCGVADHTHRRAV